MLQSPKRQCGFPSETAREREVDGVVLHARLAGCYGPGWTVSATVFSRGCGRGEGENVESAGSEMGPGSICAS